MMNTKIFISVLFLCITACSSQRNYENIDTTNLSELQSVRTEPNRPSSSPFRTELSPLRAKFLQDISLSLGAQAGLAWASQRINARLRQDEKYLDSTYNFNAMVLTHGVMPPVLEEGDFTLNLADPNTIRVADRTYKIVKQAQFRTTPPNWREYLWLSYSRPELPFRTLLPRTFEEQCAWRKGIQAGWEKGVQQASSIFQQNLALLRRDYKGMILYRKLLEQRMISPPFVSRTELGITGDGNNMNINDQVLRIVELPQLQTSGRNWNAIVVKKDD